MRALTLALLLATACEAGPSAPRAGVWNLFALSAALDEGRNIATGATDGFPGGFPATAFLKPRQPDSMVTEVAASFSWAQGRPAAYVSTDVWANYPAVWVQPMYVLVTAWDERPGAAHVLPGSKWIFSVGPGSRFYSSFWRVHYVVVPEGTPPDQYRSSRQLFAAGLEIHEGAGRLVSLAPMETIVEAAAQSLPGRLGHGVGQPPAGEGWVDGIADPVSFLDFGPDRFEWTSDDEVVEQPLFVLFAKQPDGAWQPAGLPNIGGTGPLFTRQPAIFPGNRPFFGSYWRLWSAHLPAGDDNVGVFVPATGPFEALHASVMESVRGVSVPPVTWQFADPEEAKPYLLRVALNARQCFQDQASLATCRWLDSQAALEDQLPGALAPTGITVTCPFITYAGQAVP